MVYSHRLVVNIPNVGRVVVFIFDSHKELKITNAPLKGYCPSLGKHVEFVSENILEVTNV